MTYKEFAESHQISLSAERADENPNNPDWRDADHWKCVIRRPGSRMTTYFSMGYGHKGQPPKIEDLLNCLASDAASIDNALDFEDWAAELGFSKAEKIWKAYQRQTERLRKFLGDDLFQELLDCEE